MHQQVLHHLKDNDFWLTTDRCIYWKQQNAIIVSDLHFGKTGHFRKHGIGVPQNIFKEDLQRLISLVSYFKPEQLIAVGDLFHSHANKEMDLFSKWRKDFSQLVFHLIKGNHDILKPIWYAQNEIILHQEEMCIEGISFIHDPSVEQQENCNYVFSGHVHPGVSLKIGSRQSISFPCFYFSEKMAVLPAFSRFTGTVSLKVKASDDAYAIVNQSIIKV